MFEIHIPFHFGWFAFGFSNYGESFPADYCVLWYDWKKRMHFEDSWADEEGKLSLDQSQDCRDFKIKRYGNVLKYTFQRKFDTCDEDDYVIEDGTTHIVWARGRGPLFKLSGLNVSTDFENNGMVRVQLLKNLEVFWDLDKSVKNVDILTNNVAVPSEETTYWCHVHKLPKEFERKHHIYKVNYKYFLIFVTL